MLTLIQSLTFTFHFINCGGTNMNLYHCYPHKYCIFLAVARYRISTPPITKNNEFGNIYTTLCIHQAVLSALNVRCTCQRSSGFAITRANTSAPLSWLRANAMNAVRHSISRRVSASENRMPIYIWKDTILSACLMWKHDTVNELNFAWTLMGTLYVILSTTGR